jgi:hypothetical protein
VTDVLVPLADLPGVAEAVDATRAAMDGLLREPALRRRRGEVRTASRARSAWASAKLAGCRLTFEEFEPPFGDDEDGVTASAALAVSGEVGSAAATWRRAPLQALARLHTVAMAGHLPDDALGRPRPGEGIAERLGVLAESVTDSDAPGVVVAGVVQAELLTMRPFGAGDELVARAASRVVLVARGVDPDALTTPEMGVLELGEDQYREALLAYVTGSPEGLATWLTFYAASVQRGAAYARTLCR